MISTSTGIELPVRVEKLNGELNIGIFPGIERSLLNGKIVSLSNII